MPPCLALQFGFRFLFTGSFDVAIVETGRDGVLVLSPLWMLKQRRCGGVGSVSHCFVPVFTLVLRNPSSGDVQLSRLFRSGF